MAISKKVSQNDLRIKDLINKGGSVPVAKPHEEKIKLLQLRIEEKLIKSIDDLLASGTVPKMSRHAWIIFAIKHYLELVLKHTNNNSISL